MRTSRAPAPGNRSDLDSAPLPGQEGFETWIEEELVSSQGVDLALIEKQLARTPTERLEELERVVNDLLELRGGRWPELP